jgi:hypothetical protein
MKTLNHMMALISRAWDSFLGIAFTDVLPNSIASSVSSEHDENDFKTSFPERAGYESNSDNITDGLYDPSSTYYPMFHSSDDNHL